MKGKPGTDTEDSFPAQGQLKCLKTDLFRSKSASNALEPPFVYRAVETGNLKQDNFRMKGRGVGRA